MIRVAFIKEKTDLLGPYNRFALWTQGCHRNCPGCIAQSHQSMSGGYLADEDDLIQMICSQTDIEGITISGGEPFLQAKGIAYLLHEIKKRDHLGVIIYTGYTMEELMDWNDTFVREILKNTDLLIDGSYRRELDDNRFGVGSSNQEIYPLTPRYKEVIVDYYGRYYRESKFELANDGTTLVGIPSKEMQKIWEKVRRKVQ